MVQVEHTILPFLKFFVDSVLVARNTGPHLPMILGQQILYFLGENAQQNIYIKEINVFRKIILINFNYSKISITQHPKGIRKHINFPVYSFLMLLLLLLIFLKIKLWITLICTSFGYKYVT